MRTQSIIHLGFLGYRSWFMQIIRILSRAVMLTMYNRVLTIDDLNLIINYSLHCTAIAYVLQWHFDNDPHPPSFAYMLYLVSACRSGVWSPAAGLSGAAPHNHRPPSLLGWPSAPRTDSSPPPEDAGSSWHLLCTVPALATGGAAGSPCLSTPKIVIAEKDTWKSKGGGED